MQLSINDLAVYNLLPDNGEDRQMTAQGVLQEISQPMTIRQVRYCLGKLNRAGLVTRAGTHRDRNEKVGLYTKAP